MKKRFTEEQILKILNEGKSGMKVDDVCRQNGISRATYYSWQSKFNGMEISDIKKLKTLELENNRLKKLVAEQALDIVALKDVVSRKW